MLVAVSGRTWLGRIGLVFAALLLFVVATEIVIRVLAWRSREPAREVRATWEAEHPEAKDLPELHGSLALARPNVRGLHKNVLIRTDAEGFRGPGFSAGPGPGVVRIVVTGDSVTFGEGVVEEEVYASRLGPLLDAGRQGVYHEVVNAGISGAPIEIALMRLAKANAAYRPGLFVYGYTLNDLEGEGYVYPQEMTRRRGWLYWANRQPLLVVKLVTSLLVTTEIESDPSKGPYPRELRANYFGNDATLARLEHGLDRYAELARESGVCAHLLLHTRLADLGDDHPFHPFYDRVAETARARGITVTYSYPQFAGREAQSLWVNPFDPHPNSEGHALLAEALAEGLLALPESCWERAVRASSGGDVARRAGPQDR